MLTCRTATDRWHAQGKRRGGALSVGPRPGPAEQLTRGWPLRAALLSEATASIPALSPLATSTRTTLPRRARPILSPERSAQPRTAFRTGGCCWRIRPCPCPRQTVGKLKSRCRGRAEQCGLCSFYTCADTFPRRAQCQHGLGRVGTSAEGQSCRFSFKL